MKLSLVRVCAILLCTHALACGGAAFTSTLEFSDASAGSAEDSLYGSDAVLEAGIDHSTLLDTGHAEATSIPPDGSGLSADSADSDGDARSPLDAGTLESGADVESGTPLCCIISVGSSLCASGESFPCTNSEVKCSTICTFTDPGNGTCSGEVAPCP